MTVELTGHAFGGCVHGRVVSASHRVGDLRIAEGGEHSPEISDQTSREDDAAMPARAHQIRSIHTQPVTDHLDDGQQLDWRLWSPRAVVEQLLDEQGPHLPVGDRTVRKGPQSRELVDRTLQLPDRRKTMAGEYLVGCVGEPQPARRGQPLRQLDSRLAIRAVDLDDHAGHEATDEGRGESHLTRMFVRSHHHPGAAQVDRIQRVQELVLCRHLVREKMHIVDGQQIEPAGPPAKLLNVAVAHGRNEFVRELLGGHIPNGAAVASFGESLTDALKQVCLPDAAVAVEEQGRYLGR